MTVQQLFQKQVFTPVQITAISDLLLVMGFDVESYKYEVNLNDFSSDLKNFANRLYDHKEEIPSHQLETQIISYVSLISLVLNVIKQVEKEESEKRTDLLKEFTELINSINQ